MSYDGKGVEGTIINMNKFPDLVFGIPLHLKRILCTQWQKSLASSFLDSWLYYCQITGIWLCWMSYDGKGVAGTIISMNKFPDLVFGIPLHLKRRLCTQWQKSLASSFLDSWLYYCQITGIWLCWMSYAGKGVEGTIISMNKFPDLVFGILLHLKRRLCTQWPKKPDNSGKIFLTRAQLGKYFNEVLMKRVSSTLLQIPHKMILVLQVIVKSIIGPDNNDWLGLAWTICTLLLPNGWPIQGASFSQLVSFGDVSFLGNKKYFFRMYMIGKC